MSDEAKPDRRNRRAGARSAARLAAVQAVYQLEVTDTPPASVIKEFAHFRQIRDQRSEETGAEFELVPADATLFAELVDGTYLRLPDLDDRISAVLTPEWPLDRLETVLRAILRVATFELAVRLDVPMRVVIAEYVQIAHAFFDGKEPGLVNGVLDRLGRQLRPTESDPVPS